MLVVGNIATGGPYLQWVVETVAKDGEYQRKVERIRRHVTGGLKFAIPMLM
ncbi:MAG: hypothetical protein HY321_08925 [Armatimonadetes bacterium]|nr:hypothetical protein [Armatimonadota bacterium]